MKVAKSYLDKGSKVFIEGQLETRKWADKEGRDQYTTEVVLRPYRGELTMLDGRGGASASSGSSEGFSDNGGYSSGSSPFGGGSQASAPVNDMVDDIPF